VNTHVQPEHANVTLQFQDDVIVTQSATLSINGPYTAFQAPVTVSQGGQLSVSGDLTLGVTGGGLVVVDRTFNSTIPMTIDGGTVAAGLITAPSLSLIHGAVLTSPGPVRKLELQIDGTLAVDSTSSIDVTGKGYAPGYTTGNTTTGGATGSAGGSYGGLGDPRFGYTTNRVYGDYADPDDWGSGSGGAAPSFAGWGGGLVRINVGTLQLDGKVLADGTGTGSGGSGGGILVQAGTLAGSGLIRAAGKDRSYDAGGGGRVAVYAQDFSAFDTTKITAPGGTGAGAGSVYIRDTDQPQGTLILDAGTGGNGTTPLGLPGQDTFTIPDHVIIRGVNTHVQPEHDAQSLQFQGPVIIDQSAALAVQGPNTSFAAPVTVTGSGRLSVTGNLALVSTVTAIEGGAVSVTGSLTVESALAASVGGTVTVTGTIDLEGMGFLASQPGGIISVGGDLVGATKNGDLFDPQGTVTLAGSGTAVAPQHLEIMSQDLGATPDAFSHNFAYQTLALSSNTYVRLIDNAHNSSGTGSEALYVNALIVPKGSTLDLNGLRIYVRASQIGGTVVGGKFGLGIPLAGAISSPSQVDDWTFFGRANQDVTVVVNTGAGSSTPPLQPYLNYAQVQVVDPKGNVLAIASNAQAGTDILLAGVALTTDGVYHVKIQAPPGHPSSTGYYVLSTWDATVHSFTTNLNQVSYGQLASPYNVDQWTFSALANEQVRFDFLNSASSQFRFDLSGPAGFVGFSGLSTTSDPVTLPTSGSYILTAYTVQGATGAYTFRLDEMSETDLAIGTSYQGSLVGSGQAQLFKIDVTQSQGLLVVLQDPSSADQNELYLRYGAPPTRSDYQFRFSNGAAADQQVLVPSATPGSWYALLYATSVPQPSTYTILATGGDIFLTGSTPKRTGTNVGTVLTLTGSGFDQTTGITLVDSFGSVVSLPLAMSVDLPTQITAVIPTYFMAPGVYSILVSKPGVQPARLSDALTVDPGGAANLQTDIVLPSAMGRHQLATIYVEYSNTGDVPMFAPLLTLSSTQNPFLTLDSSLLTAGLWTSALPAGFSHSIELLGSGATPGVLQPGETVRVPVYYAGLQQPWDFSQSSISFNLSVTTTDNTTPIDWQSLKDGLRPPYIDPATWSALYPGLTAQIGSRWGALISQLDADASYLGQLGETVTDVSQLWQFEIRQAIGLNPVSQIASNVDVSVPAPGMPLTFSRSYSPSILNRSILGPLGMGWTIDGGWERTLTKLSDGTVVVADTNGAIRSFQPDSRSSSYFDQPGDHGTLIANSDGTFSLLETDGTLTHFLLGGQVDYVQDTNGNRITAGYSNGLLTSLSHSDGQALQIAYNSGRIFQVTDPFGRRIVFSYDSSNQHLMSVQEADGSTYAYTYDTGSNPATQNALVQENNPTGLQHVFTYDAEGRLSGISANGHSDPITFTYGPSGKLSETNATNDTTQFFFDNRGVLIKLVNAVGNASYQAFDSNLNLVQTTDAAGRSYQFIYDGLGNITGATDPLGSSTRFAYAGPFNRLTSRTDANGNLTRYGYDTSGNLTSITYADGSVEKVTYDPQGNPLTTTNRRGDPIGYTYNTAGQITTKSYSDGTTDTYSYDAHGNLIQTTDSTGTTKYDYDADDRLIKITDPSGRYLQFIYNTAGQRTTSTDQLGYQLNYHYDALGRLASITDSSGAMIVSYQYDVDGRLARKDMGNGTYTTDDYLPDGNISHLINYAPDGTILSRFGYTYDSRGRETLMTTLQGSWHYSYDDLGQLTAWTAPDGSSATYKYDAMGNRVQVTQSGQTTSSTTNNLNQYTTVGGVTYTYDADGNLIRKVSGSDVTTYSYDPENRLIAVTHGADVQTYTYDALGKRVASTSGGVVTQYMIDPAGLGNVVGQYDGAGNLDDRYDYGFGLVSHVDGAGATHFYNFSAIGNTSELTGPRGNSLDSYTYDPSGIILAKTETMANPFQYVAEYGVTEEPSGLLYMRARFYDAGLGRFTSPDSSGIAGGLNLYEYVANQVSGRIDPTGLDWVDVGGEAGGEVVEIGNTGKELLELEKELYHTLPVLDQWRRRFQDETGEPDPLPKLPRFPDTPPPGDPPGDKGGHGTAKTPTIIDPNSLIGPAGFGPAGFITPSSEFPYRIDFENEPTATAPAQRVDITDQLDPSLDWSTFQLTGGRLRRHDHHHPGGKPAFPDHGADDLQQPDLRRPDRARSECRHGAGLRSLLLDQSQYPASA